MEIFVDNNLVEFDQIEIIFSILCIIGNYLL
jgi:hypothetical protein